MQEEKKTPRRSSGAREKSHVTLIIPHQHTSNRRQRKIVFPTSLRVWYNL